MKRALLIAGGTVGGLGAVLMITPPNLSKTTLIAIDTAAPASSAASPLTSAERVRSRSSAAAARVNVTTSSDDASIPSAT